MSAKCVYLNGSIVPLTEARISVYNGGWLHGAGLFETMRAERCRVFRLDEHLDRLCASAEVLLVPIDRSKLPDAETLTRLMVDNALTDARVRLTVTAGDVLEGDESDQRPLTVCVTAAPLTTYPKHLYDTGITVMISKYRQSADDPLVGHKTTNYLSRLTALKEAARARCGEALWFTPKNLLAEASISNAFIVSNGVLATPPLDTPVLPGIARALVLELCAAGDIESAERPINVNDLLDADEVFLTNSIMQVLPVARIEKRDIGNGKPGPVTCRLLQLYRDRVADECKNRG